MNRPSFLRFCVQEIEKKNEKISKKPLLYPSFPAIVSSVSGRCLAETFCYVEVSSSNVMISGWFFVVQKVGRVDVEKD